MLVWLELFRELLFPELWELVFFVLIEIFDLRGADVACAISRDYLGAEILQIRGPRHERGVVAVFHKRRRFEIFTVIRMDVDLIEPLVRRAENHDGAASFGDFVRLRDDVDDGFFAIDYYVCDFFALVALGKIPHADVIYYDLQSIIFIFIQDQIFWKFYRDIKRRLRDVGLLIYERDHVRTVV